MASVEFVCRPRLVWPPGIARRADGERRPSPFRVLGGPSEGADRIARALAAFTRPGRTWRTEAVEIAADWPVGRLGGFLASAKRGEASGDPGAVLSLLLDGRALTLPCDAYRLVEGNLAAIAAHLEAIRAVERHGVATVEQLLSAHAALPRNAGGVGRAWWEVLGVAPDASAAVVEAAYRALARERHPDAGGSEAAMAELNLARDEWRAGR